jgi:putative transposase
MPKYNPDIHHRRSIRLQHYDYSQAGSYFITLCTLNRQCLFGEVLSGEMRLSELGVMIRDEWLKTPGRRPNVGLGEWVVMPNHFHAIVMLNGCGKEEDGGGRMQYAPTVKSPSQTLGAIVRGFKSAVTRAGAYETSIWQRNYWEHIIRDEHSHHEIATYIANNPTQWENDTLHP